MVEVLEYCLVVMVSSLFVAGSVATYGSYSGFVSGVQFKAASSAVSALAMEAQVNGSSGSELTLPSSTIGCQGGVLTIASGSRVAVEDLHTTCSFRVVVSAGPHQVLFRSNGSALAMEVE